MVPAVVLLNSPDKVRNIETVRQSGTNEETLPQAESEPYKRENATDSNQAKSFKRPKTGERPLKDRYDPYETDRSGSDHCPHLQHKEKGEDDGKENQSH